MKLPPGQKRVLRNGSSRPSRPWSGRGFPPPPTTSPRPWACARKASASTSNRKQLWNWYYNSTLVLDPQGGNIAHPSEQPSLIFFGKVYKFRYYVRPLK